MITSLFLEGKAMVVAISVSLEQKAKGVAISVSLKQKMGVATSLPLWQGSMVRIYLSLSLNLHGKSGLA